MACESNSAWTIDTVPISDLVMTKGETEILTDWYDQTSVNKPAMKALNDTDEPWLYNKPYNCTFSVGKHRWGIITTLVEFAVDGAMEAEGEDAVPAGI